MSGFDRWLDQEPDESEEADHAAVASYLERGQMPDDESFEDEVERRYQEHLAYVRAARARGWNIIGAKGRETIHREVYRERVRALRIERLERELEEPRTEEVEEPRTPPARRSRRMRSRGVTLHELARVMGTSVRMIELHYGRLVDGAQEAILARLEQPDEGEQRGLGH